jgi:hypothetical protein
MQNENTSQPTGQPPIAQQPQKSTLKWILLIVLPFAALFLVAFMQAIIHFILNPNNNGSSPLLATVFNIISILVGAAGVIGIILIPLWIIMLVKDSNHNKTTSLSDVVKK